MKIVARANAKINLTLAINGKRSDGYHIIDTVMQSVSLYDTVTVKSSKDISLVCSESSISSDKNIAFKAAKTFFDYTKLNGGADIFIEKSIPLASGLGGGSTDAAAVICSLNKIYNTNLSYEQLCEIAFKLGADVPFCIVGGTARAEGVGEKLTQLNPITGVFFVLTKIGEKPSTKTMYSKLDSIKYEIPNIENSVNNIKENKLSELFNGIGNSFSSLWNYNTIFEILKPTKPSAVSLSGSGPSVFAAYFNYNDAMSATKLLKIKNFESVILTPENKSICFE